MANMDCAMQKVEIAKTVLEVEMLWQGEEDAKDFLVSEMVRISEKLSPSVEETDLYRAIVIAGAGLGWPEAWNELESGFFEGFMDSVAPLRVRDVRGGLKLLEKGFSACPADSVTFVDQEDVGEDSKE